MRLLTQLLNEVKMTVVEMKRYFFETLSMAIITYVVFMAVFWGLKALAGDAVKGTSLDKIIIGYVMWMFAVISLQRMNAFFSREIAYGTFEQLYLSPTGIIRILFGRIVSHTVFSMVICCIVLFFCMLTTSRWLRIDFLLFILFLSISVLSFLGIGLFVGGLTLVFKRVGYVVQLFTFGILGLMLLKVYPFTVFSLFPFLPTAYTANAAIVMNMQFPLYWYGYLVLNGLVYLILGIYFFRVMEKKAKVLNTLGQY